MKKLIAGALVVCVTVVLVAVAIIRHVNHKQDVAWCHDHGYAKYATKDSFCVGAGGKLIKVGGGRTTRIEDRSKDRLTFLPAGS